MIELLPLFLLAMCLEFIDNGLGGGFGTIMSPLLILFGYDPKIVVPGILFSEMCSGLVGGLSHAYYKNVNWRAVGVTLTSSLVAMALASFLVGSMVPSQYIKWYISLLAVAMGAFIVIRSYKNIREGRKFNSPMCLLLGGVIGFNKGSTGGGYGPLSVSGYMLMGLTAATAIGTTTVAEGIACVIGFSTYAVTTQINWGLVASITLGSVLVDPISAYLNNRLKKRLEPPFHGRLIGLAMLLLGLFTVWRLTQG